MRKAVVEALSLLADRDERIVLVTGDLGFMVLEPFAQRHPTRFFNAGVAEQNMVGLAVGLAEAGFIPFVYSIATFATLRPYEFIRDGAILHELPLRILGVGGGFEYGSAGPTHHALEDVAVMRTQPGIAVMAPADREQATRVLMATWDMPGPVYYRLSKNATTLPELNGAFELGRAQIIRSGRDLAIVSMGAAALQALDAADRLARAGVFATVAIAASINPAPVDDLRAILSSHRVVLTVEAHYVNGGLGSLVAEVLAEAGLGCRLVRCGVRKSLAGPSGREAWLLAAHGLSGARLAETAIAALS